MQPFDMDSLISEYQDALGATKEPTAAALLCVAASLHRFAVAASGLSREELSHEICMGIRTGLFGARAEADQDVREGFSQLADAVAQLRRDPR